MIKIRVHFSSAMNANPSPSLDPERIRAALRPRVTIGREILIFEETDSTNDLARRAGEDGLPEGLAIFAETQRAGRGTQGRRWMSPPYRGLWFSVLLRPKTVSVERWPELTFCAALAVAETAEISTGRAARIKWPNDVLVGERKVAGILVECHHRQNPGFVVVGIGLNVLQRREEFAPELRDQAGSLAMMLEAPSARRSSSCCRDCIGAVGAPIFPLAVQLLSDHESLRAVWLPAAGGYRQHKGRLLFRSRPTDDEPLKELSAG